MADSEACSPNGHTGERLGRKPPWREGADNSEPLQTTWAAWPFGWPCLWPAVPPRPQPLPLVDFCTQERNDKPLSLLPTGGRIPHPPVPQVPPSELPGHRSHFPFHSWPPLSQWKTLRCPVLPVHCSCRPCIFHTCLPLPLDPSTIPVSAEGPGAIPQPTAVL